MVIKPAGGALLGGGMHSAGIFSDMTVDGPEIGTLVVVIDRAKNLPNVRRMGKQDPYCAARLAKEAKKTETDWRGGQTPKWDQELRFTVHDSLDYQRLKVSVFNDDKKAELIGEAWVPLKDIIIPGGGQSDTWHNLNCKGRYAGDVRIELTYYDTRPKAERPAPERRTQAAANGAGDGQNAPVGGPREANPVRRRPLPSNPGSAPSSAHAADQMRPAPRVQNRPREMNKRPQHAFVEDEPPNEPASSDERRFNHSEQQLGQPSMEPIQPSTDVPRDVQYSAPPVQSIYSDGHTEQYPASTGYENGRGPQAGERRPSFGLQQSGPLAPLPSDFNNRMPLSQSRQDDYTSHVKPLYSYENRPHSFIEPPHSRSAPVVPTVESDRRARHSMYYGHQGEFAHEQPHSSAMDLSLPLHNSPQAPLPSDPYASYNAALSLPKPVPKPAPYDPYDHHSPLDMRRTMQPSVEEEDEVPPPPPVHRSSAPATTPQVLQHNMPYPSEMAPAPLRIAPSRDNLYRDQPNHPGQLTQGTHHDMRMVTYEQSYSGRRSASPLPIDKWRPHNHRDETSHASRNTVNSTSLPGYPSSGQELPDYHSQLSYGRAGGHDTREQFQHASDYSTPSRQRQLSAPDHHTPPTYETPPRQYSVPQPEQSYSNPSPYSQPSHSPQPDPAPMIKPRAVSPAEANDRQSRTPNRNLVPRKSVSPRPPEGDTPTSQRRLSNVPFSPDSFDELNPNLASHSAATTSNSSNPHSPHAITTSRHHDGGAAAPDTPSSIIGLDGREIDPSDHLPVDSWAPEPELKGRRRDPPTARDRERLIGARARGDMITPYRASLGGGGSPSPLGSSPAAGAGGSPLTRTIDSATENISPSPLAASSRNRLQKRGVGAGAYASSSSLTSAPGSGAGSPLSGSPYGAPRGGVSHQQQAPPPPVPAKIPLGGSGGAAATGDDEMARLSREMESIDIGSGGRRRGLFGGRGKVRGYGF